MTRLEKFESFQTHIVQGKLYRSLNAKEREMCRAFIKEGEHLSRDDFQIKVNRWLLDQEKPKHFLNMWSLVLQAT